MTAPFVLPAAPSKIGYIFMGWKCSDGHTHEAGETVVVNSDLTLPGCERASDIEPGGALWSGRARRAERPAVCGRERECVVLRVGEGGLRGGADERRDGYGFCAQRASDSCNDLDDTGPIRAALRPRASHLVREGPGGP